MQEAQETPTSEAEAVSEAAPEAAAVQAEDTVSLGKKVAELEAQLKEKDAKYLYMYADFENFKKRQLKERSDWVKFGWENIARSLLEVLDNLERAVTHTPAGTDKNLMTGLNMVVQQFKTSFQQQGVQEIQCLGKPFDPNTAEAVGQEASEQPEGHVIQEHVKGYTLHGRLLRPARVVISGGKTGPS